MKEVTLCTGSKEVWGLTLRKVLTKYVETIVLNNMDIEPFLQKEYKPTTMEMLETINAFDEDFLFVLLPTKK